MTTLRFAAPALAALLALAPPSPACSLCGPWAGSRQTLRMHHVAAGAVLHGQLKNPRFDPRTDEGFTDFHVTTVLKDDPARGGRTTLTVPRYLPVIGNTPPDYLFFGTVTNGALDLSFGVPASPAVVAYLKAAAALDDKDPAKKLAFFFQHLDSADPTIAADAFVEFARASDAEILKAAGRFDPADCSRGTSCSPRRTGGRSPPPCSATRSGRTRSGSRRSARCGSSRRPAPRSAGPRCSGAVPGCCRTPTSPTKPSRTCGGGAGGT